MNTPTAEAAHSHHRHGLESFTEVSTDSANLIRAAHIPDINTLRSGDLVICDEGWNSQEFVKQCTQRGVQVRTSRYRYENERVGMHRSRRAVTIDYAPVLDLTKHTPPGQFFAPEVVDSSTHAFARAWDALSTPTSETQYERAADHVDESWLPFLPHHTLNPAQVQAINKIRGLARLVVVAPTGAGKTTIGMLAALNEIRNRGGKAAWLVPQRSLTAELDRELDLWRAQGVKVAALSGDSSTDFGAAEAADLWVATTEKFEALSRASSMKDTIDQIGTVVVDEIHLLGDPSRGAILENLLARMRGSDPHLRLVGLSATASNADQVADWLAADLLEISWRPTRLTEQVLAIPTGDRTLDNRYRNDAVTTLVRDVSHDDGSTLVFCGTKANVRSTALAIAESRGEDITTIDPTDVDAVAAVCERAGVGLHYADWAHKHTAEARFRGRELDVLVATSTLAAGVNTPARVVIVRDTSIGSQPMEVSMVQQMFGRAGRAGAEREGWAFLLATPDEAAIWRQRIARGYTITSAIQHRLADHLLAEIVQKNVTTLQDAEQWWASTFAHFQGERSVTALNEARTFLQKWHFIDLEEGPDPRITATRLGSVTSRMMVSVRDAANLLAKLRDMPTPRGHMQAEESLIEIVAHNVHALATAQEPAYEQVPAVARALATKGEVHAPNPAKSRTPARLTGGHVSQAGLLLFARSPRTFATSSRTLAGIPATLLQPVLRDSPRHFAWITAAGRIGAIPAWASVVSFDLGHRIPWHRSGPPRGSGRLLWLCDRHSPDPTRTKTMYERMREQGVTSPNNAPDQGSHGALTLVRKKGTVAVSPGATVYSEPDQKGPSRWTHVPLSEGRGESGRLVVAFGSDGDCRGTGWMTTFSEISSVQ